MMIKELVNAVITTCSIACPNFMSTNHIHVNESTDLTVKTLINPAGRARCPDGMLLQ